MHSVLQTLTLVHNMVNCPGCCLCLGVWVVSGVIDLLVHPTTGYSREQCQPWPTTPISLSAQFPQIKSINVPTILFLTVVPINILLSWKLWVLLKVQEYQKKHAFDSNYTWGLGGCSETGYITKNMDVRDMNMSNWQHLTTFSSQNLYWSADSMHNAPLNISVITID